MLGIKEAKMVLSQLGMNDNEIEKYAILVEPFTEFHKYIMQKLNISSEETEKMTEKYSREFIIKKIAELQKSGVDIDSISEVEYFGMAGEAMKEFASEHSYDSEKCEILEKNLIEVSTMFVDITKNMTKNGNLK
jgi:hypothetical protein